MPSKTLLITVLVVLMLPTAIALAGGDPARGAELSGDCVACHGEDGKGDDYAPAIAGRDAATLVTFLKMFRSGERTSEDNVMQEYTANLSDQDLADVAAYFASLPSE